jgi:Mrp family chromosome partitioning ATPase
MEKFASAALATNDGHEAASVPMQEPAARAVPVGRAIAPPHVEDDGAFEALAANLWARYEGASTMKTVLFVGAGRESLSAPVAMDFAATLARGNSGCVLVIDVNPRAGGRMHANRREEPHLASLAALLTEGAAIETPTPGRENLYVLSCASDRGQSRMLFRSEAFRRFLHTASTLFRNVVLSAPHPAAHPETLLLGRWADGVVMVVEAERTRRQSALWTARQIDDSGGRLLGVVLKDRRFRIPGWLYSRM